MLYLIGLGLGNVTDISVRGLEIVKNADEVYLEAYTSILTVGKDALVGLRLYVTKLRAYLFDSDNYRMPGHVS